MTQGLTLWLTGLPASGKTQIATRIEEALLERGLDAERLDEGEWRQDWLPGLGFTASDEDNLNRLVGHVCHLLTRNGVIAVAAAVSPSQDVRNEIRGQIGRFVEVHLRCPAEICQSRDPAGNGAKALSGSLRGFPGVDRTYEEPVNPEVLLDTGSDDAESCVKQVLRTLELMEWIPRQEGSDYNPEEEAKISQRLKDLGYV